MSGDYKASRSTARLLIPVFICLFLCPVPSCADAGAAGPLPHEIIRTGILPNGPSFDIVESGGYLYVAEGSEVRVYQIGTDAQVRGLRWDSAIEKITINDAVYGLTMEGSLLYVASAGSLTVVNTSNPYSLKVVSVLKNPYSYTTMRDIVVNGTTAYIAVRDAGVLVVNVTDPSHPIPGQKVTFDGYNRPWRLAVSGSYLYVPLETDGRLEVLDISKPLEPVSAGRYSAGEATSFSGVAVQDGYAYVAEYHVGIRIVDVHTPSRPHEVSRITDVNANDIRIEEGRAYVSVRYQGFNIYAIPTPGTLRLMGQASGMEGYIEGIWPWHGRTFLAGESFGFAIYDTTNASSPSLMVKVPVIGGVESLALYRNYLVVGAHNLGVWIVDVTDRSHPQEVSFIDVGGRNRVVDIQGTTLYTAGEWGGLSIVDIGDPLHPVIVTKDFGDNIGTLLADGRYVYTQVGIVDVSNPRAPAYVVKDPMFNGRFAKYGNDHLLVADSSSTTTRGIRVLDIRDRAHPRVIATFSPDTAFYDVAVSGSTAVGLTGNDLIAIDLTDVTAPRELSRLSYPGIWFGYSLHMDGTMVYAVGGPIGAVRAFNISNPGSISLDASADLPVVDPYLGITSNGSEIYAGNKWGIFSLSLRTPTPVPTTVITTLPLLTPATVNITPSLTTKRTGQTPLVLAPVCALFLVLFFMGWRRRSA